MNLGELKKALSRFPPDMDDLDVLIATVEGDDLAIGLLAYVGARKVDEMHTLPELGSAEAAHWQADHGGLRNMDGTSFDL